MAAQRVEYRGSIPQALRVVGLRGAFKRAEERTREFEPEELM